MIPGLHSDEAFMKQALTQAKYALEEGEVPIGAVVVCDNKIIARAYNQVEKLNDVTAHAEILAITAAENFLGTKYLTQCRLFVTLEPCTMCAGASYWSQLEGVVYGASDEKRGYSALAPKAFHPKTNVQHGVLAEECGELVKDFFTRLRE
ncbi:nucleoside deaminase [Reichenbachiella sp. MALMAid0571]|uniref:nucleoside deaminase n=1 Tax=Reichenbachiella sp. MALMAid0571 TaxID=3143939 RepID=UPI0032DEC113